MNHPQRPAVPDQDLENNPELELAIMVKESERAGINYLWHPKFREYANRPGLYPLDYEAYYSDPRNKSEREKQQKLLEPFNRQEWLSSLLKRHPDKRQTFGHLDPYTRMSEGELIARHEYLNPTGEPFPEPMAFGVKHLIRLAQNQHAQSASDQAGTKLSTAQKALEYTGQNEGGYVNNIADKGQETFNGLSRVYNPDWEGWAKVDEAKKEIIEQLRKENPLIPKDAGDDFFKQKEHRKPAWALADAVNKRFAGDQEMADLVEKRYIDNYWKSLKFDDLLIPQDIKIKIYDMVVKEGKGAAGPMIQRILNKMDPAEPITPAGNIGDATRSKLTKVLASSENQHLFRALLTKELANHFKDRVAKEEPNVPKEKRQAKYLNGWLARAKRWPEQE